MSDEFNAGFGSDEFISIDFTGTSSDGPPLLEPGEYILTLSDLGMKPPKEGKQYGTAEVVWEAENGMKIWDYIWMGPQFRWKFKAMLEHLTGEEFEGNIQVRPSELFGKRITAVVDIEEQEYKGEMQKKNTISAYAPAA